MMRKMIVLLMTALLMLGLVACGSRISDGKNEEKKPASESTEQDAGNSTSQEDAPESVEDEPVETPDESGEEIVVDVELLDLADADIVAIKNGKTVMEGEEAAEVIAQIPAEIKKYVGELDADDCKVLANKDFTLFDFKMKFRVPNASVKSYYDAVTEYYKSLGGTVTKEESNGDWHDLEMTFDWGEMRGCNYTLHYYENDYAAISVEFYINAN